MAGYKDEIKAIWDSLDEETRLAVTHYVMDAIWEHAIKGGTYRHLIYDRLGFSKDAYSYLYPVGHNISNFLKMDKEK